MLPDALLFAFLGGVACGVLLSIGVMWIAGSLVDGVKTDEVKP